jgi:hypothetical protein
MKIYYLSENVLYQWLHGYIQPSNLSSALLIPLFNDTKEEPSENV